MSGKAVPKKFELTSETKIWFGRTLYRIRALISFGIVKAGDAGGFVEKEENLARVSGNAWVYGNAQVSGDARVSGNAQVYGDARVYGNAWVYGDARVSGNAWVYGNAQVSGDARVSGNAWVYGDARVSKPMTYATRSDGYGFILLQMADGSFRVSAGCRFFTMTEAREHWTRRRGGTCLGVESLAILDFFQAVIGQIEITPKRIPSVPCAAR